MDFLRHFLPLRGAKRKAFPFNATSVFKTHVAAKLLIRPMRLTGVIILVFCLRVSAKSGAQERIAINVQRVSVQKLFAEIERKTGFTFFYDVTTLEETRPVTVAVKEATVEQILRMALVSQALEYTITDKTIFVKKKHNALPERVQADTTRGGRKITVTGIVTTDAELSVQDIDVTVNQEQKGAITNARGQLQSSAELADGISTIVTVHVEIANMRQPSSFPVGLFLCFLCNLVGAVFLGITAHRKALSGLTREGEKPLRRWIRNHAGFILDTMHCLALAYEIYCFLK
jgi:hypothetical protein